MTDSSLINLTPVSNVLGRAGLAPFSTVPPDESEDGR